MQDHVAGGLAVSHDSQWVINASLDGQVRFRDAKTWTVQLVLRGHGPEGELGPLFLFSPTILRLTFQLLQFARLTTTLVRVS